MAVKTVQRQSARERLLAAADQLFYTEGVHVVGVERIAERADVTKARSTTFSAARKSSSGPTSSRTFGEGKNASLAF